jgi:hypothetical protein
VSKRVVLANCGIAISLIFLVGCTSTPQVEGDKQSANPEQSESQLLAMPAFSKEFSKMASDFYKISWTKDGYPGKLQDDGSIWEHPIYPIYVLDDYMQQYEELPSEEMRKALDSVAHAAVERMQSHEGALVFWYEPGNGARLFEKHYSALTQGYYAERLWKAGVILDDKSLLEAASKAFLALTVPHEKGGVLYSDKNGISIAEVPQEPNSYILNGWQSALVSSWKYYELSGDPIAYDLVKNSSKTMEKLLPLYDAPKQSNSRYGLTGFTYLRTIDADLNDVSVSIPSEGTFGLTNYESRWANHRVNERQVNIVFSLASYPSSNQVTLDVSEPTKVQLYVGDYDPISSSPVNNRWVTVGEVDENSNTLDIPWDLVEQIVYPTNFVKVIDGRNTNVYHPIHINRLRELREITDSDEFTAWADKWEKSMCTWGDLYPGLDARGFSGGRPIQNDELCN